MQEALTYFIVFCAAVICVRRYAPQFWRRVQSWLRSLAARLSGKPVAQPAEDMAGSVQRISPDALKRTIPKGKAKAG